MYSIIKLTYDFAHLSPTEDYVESYPKVIFFTVEYEE